MSAGNLLRLIGPLALMAGVAIAQTTQTPTTPTAPGGGSGTPTTPTTPTRPTTPTTPTTPQQPSTDRQNFPERPIFLSGRVIMEDGTAPSESVTIERVCGGVIRPEAHTDGKGYFHFQLGENTQVFADASTSSVADAGFGSRGSSMNSTPFGSRGVSERDLMNCELRASLGGYRSTLLSLAGRRAMDNPEVGTIILHPMVKVEGLTISATTAMAPKDAKKAFEKGRDAMKKNKLPEAQKDFEKAVEIYPKFSAAWFSLGLAKEQQKDLDGAKQAYAQSLAADSKFVSPYLQLAQIAANENRWQDVADTTDRLVKLNPYDFPRAWFMNAVANYTLRNMDAAEQSARTAAKNDPDNHMPKVHHLLGVILAQKQDYPAAAAEMRNYLKLVPNATDADMVKKQISDIDKVAGKQETAGNK